MSVHKTILTERGQVSVPAEIRKAAHLKPGQLLRWEMISETEMRVTVAPLQVGQGPWAALGYARRLNPNDTRSSDRVLAELREGEVD